MAHLSLAMGGADGRRIGAPEVFEAASEAAAIEQAGRRPWAHGYALWAGERFVAYVRPRLAERPPKRCAVRRSA